jgi:hypothetical protein
MAIAFRVPKVTHAGEEKMLNKQLEKLCSYWMDYHSE